MLRKLSVSFFLALMASLVGLPCAQAQEIPKATPKTTVEAQEKDPFEQNKNPIAIGGLLGATAAPGNVGGLLHADWHVGRYLSFGPMVQVAGWDSRLFITVTGGGRFHLPIFMVDENLQVTYQTSVGYFFKRDIGFNFDNFVVTTGPGIDYFFRKNVAFESMFLANINNDNVDDFFYSLLVGLKFLF